MYKQRLLKAQKTIKSAEALLVTNRHNIRYLSGFSGTNAAILLLKKKALFYTDSRYFAEVKDLVPRFFQKIILKENLTKTLAKSASSLKVGKILFEENDLRYATFLSIKKSLGSKIKLAPVTNLVETLRAVKDDEEISIIKKAQSITDRTFIAVKKSLKHRQTEQEIAWNLERIAHDFGADGLSFPPIIAIGKNSAVPHHESSKTKLKRGDLILIDMGIKYRGYCTDMTRMVFTATPSPEQKEIYNIVMEAQKLSINKIKAGMTCSDGDLIARNFLKKHQIDKKFLHSLGHGVGLQIHEFPGISPKSDQIIPERAVITVEPGIYLDGKFGVRIEDMILTGPKRNIILTRTPKSLESAIHKLI